MASNHAAQPARDENIQNVVAYYRSGCKDDCSTVGIELEHILLHTDGTPVSYYEEAGTKRLFDSLRSRYERLYRDDDGNPIWLAREGEVVTLEPAAQVELSTAPFARLADALAAIEDFEGTLAAAARTIDARPLTMGYHPTRTADQLYLIPKKRYEFMDRYFHTLGTTGHHMMRCSASTQVAIDFTDEADCLRKLRLAYACVPIFSLITDNAPIYEAVPRDINLVRTRVWQNVDNARCGLVPGALDADFSWERYAAYLLDTPAIVGLDDAGELFYTDQTFGELYAEKPMTREQLEHMLSMFWNDVRLKTYLEIRPADSMPAPYVVAYAGLIKGLFSNEAGLTAMDELFDGVDAAAFLAAKEALMRNGYAARVYGRPVAGIADALVDIAEAGLRDEAGFLAPLAQLVSKRETLADRGFSL